MPETKCNVCQKNLILDEENVCAQCELINESDKKIETFNNVDCHCGTCKDVVDKNTEGLYCDVCDRWYHNAYGCCEIPLTEYLHHLLKEAPNNVKWFCDKCIWEREKWINSLKVGINNENDNDIGNDNDNGVSDDLSDIEIEKNIRTRRKRGRPRTRRVYTDDEDSEYKYDITNEPEVIIDERKKSPKRRKEKKKLKKVKKDKDGRKKRKYTLTKPRNNFKYTCDLCGRHFMKLEFLEAHKLTHQGIEKPFKCTECDKSFKLKSWLQQHEITHNPIKPFFCDICEKAFKWKSAYQRHEKEYHSDDVKLLECSLCDFKTTNQSRVDAHMRKHSDYRPFKCDEPGCDHAAKTKWTLKAHVDSVHSTEKPFVCQECNKAFKKSDELKNHMYKHTGAWPFKCAVCDMGFGSESALVIHARIHTGERPYACTICDVKMRTKNGMTKHIMTHSGEKNFPCDICGKRLAHAGALKTHRMIHTGEKPHTCELCGKKCRLKSSLKKHLEFHRKTNTIMFNKPYECEMCGNKYSTMKSLNRHRNGNAKQGPCQGDPILRKNDVSSEHKPDLPSFRPVSGKPPGPPRKKANLKPTIEQALHNILPRELPREMPREKPREPMNQHANQEQAALLHNLTTPQNFQNPPPNLLYAGVTPNNYQQYHEMFMNASSSQWTTQNKFWN